jgi:hypothetical protein
MVPIEPFSLNKITTELFRLLLVQTMFDERIEIELKNGFSNIIDNN